MIIPVGGMWPVGRFQEALHVKITNGLAAAAAFVAAGSVGLLGAPVAWADDASTTTLGSQAKLDDGNVVQGWTITNLKTSTDAIPYPVAGTLWEATATDEAIQGGATPIVSNLNARAKSGETYRVLFGVATPQGVNPSTLAQGEKTTGKVYFDVTGDTPDSVVYNAGGHDLLVWVQPPPSRQGGTSYSSPGRGQTSQAPAATPATPVPGAPAAAGSPAAATATEGSPLPASAPGRAGPAPRCLRVAPVRRFRQAAKAPRFPRAVRARLLRRPPRRSFPRRPPPDSSGVARPPRVQLVEVGAAGIGSHHPEQRHDVIGPRQRRPALL
jgi:hypothetical protein